MKDFCLSLDVAKGKSMVCMASRDGEILLGPAEFRHTSGDLARLFTEAESVSSDYAVMMEATGACHLAPQRFFLSKGKEVVLANPLRVSMGKATLRKTKTDKKDAEMLCEAYFTGNYSPTGESYGGLKAEARFVESMSDDLRRAKTKLKELGEICFPDLELIYPGSSYCGLPQLAFMAAFPHPDILRGKSLEAVEKAMNGGKRKHAGKHVRPASKAVSFTPTLIPGTSSDDPQCRAFSALARHVADTMLWLEDEKLSFIESAEDVFPFDVWRSFPGIGKLIAAYLTAELGDITRFENEKKLTAFCGLDPTIVQSGRSINWHGPISKRGSSHARLHLYQAVMMIMRQDGLKGEDSDITAYYKKKRSEGKHHYAAVTACAAKLLRKMYYRCKDRKSAN